MSAFFKVNCFVGDLGLKLHNLNTDALMVYLTNTAPVATNTVYNTPADLATGGGYTAGGASASNTYSQTAGVGNLGGADITWTASTGFGPFRYAVLYNNTSATKPLIGYWDYGSAVTLLAGETFLFDMTTTLLTIT